jgi:hypothetical protein
MGASEVRGACTQDPGASDGDPGGCAQDPRAEALSRQAPSPGLMQHPAGFCPEQTCPKQTGGAPRNHATANGVAGGRALRSAMPCCHFSLAALRWYISGGRYAMCCSHRRGGGASQAQGPRAGGWQGRASGRASGRGSALRVRRQGHALARVSGTGRRRPGKPKPAGRRRPGKPKPAGRRRPGKPAGRTVPQVAWHTANSLLSTPATRGSMWAAPCSSSGCRPLASRSSSSCMGSCKCEGARRGGACQWWQQAHRSGGGGFDDNAWVTSMCRSD